MTEGLRRGVFALLFVLAVAGALALMASPLVNELEWRAALQILGGAMAVGFGATASVLAWRWWGGRESR